MEQFLRAHYNLPIEHFIVHTAVYYGGNPLLEEDYAPQPQSVFVDTVL